MSSHREIENLIHRSTRLADEGRYDEMLGELMKDCLFWVKRELEPPHERSDQFNQFTAAQMLAFLKQTPPKVYGKDNKQYTYHIINNLEIYVDEDAGTAKSFSRIQTVQGVPEINFPLQFIASGIGEATFKRVNGKWQFATHKQEFDVMGDISKHW